MGKHLKAALRKLISYIKDWRTFIAFGLSALIVNCWGLPFLLIDAGWSKAVFGTYIAYMCIPFLNLTIPLGILLKRILFRKRGDNDKENVNSVNESSRD